MSNPLFPPFRIQAAVVICAVIAVTFVAPVGATAQSTLSPPGPPVNLRLVAVGDGSATVSWDAPEATDGQAAPTGYQVPYREIATEPGSQPAVAEGWWGSDHVDAAAKPETTVRDLTNGVWYEMRVESLVSCLGNSL